MNSSWPRRGLALVVLLLLGVAMSAPVLAHTGDDLEAVMEEYTYRSDAKLVWLEQNLAAAETDEQRLGVYQTARDALVWYADDAIDDLFLIAGSHPELVEQAEGLAELVEEMEQDYLDQAELLYESSTGGSSTTTSSTTTTVPQTTTTVKTKPSTTTTTRPTTTTSPSTTTTSPSTTTTSTPPQTTTSTTMPAPPSTSSTTTTVPTTTTSVPPTAPPSVLDTTTPLVIPPSLVFTPSRSSEAPPPNTTSTTTPDAGPQEAASTESVSPPGSEGFLAAFGDPLPSEADNGFAGGFTALLENPSQDLVAGIRSVESLPVTGMLMGYVPASLPDGLAVPVVGLLAIFEMILGALVASFQQLGGPLSAAGVYLAYSVWRHLVSKT